MMLPTKAEDNVDVSASSVPLPPDYGQDGNGQDTVDTKHLELLTAAGITAAPDDHDLPCLTLRMWVIGVSFCIFGCGLNTLYTFRYPSISISQSTAQFLAYPLGKAWERLVPDWTLTIFGWKLRLNPGRFNYKENILIFILANVSFQTRLSADVLTEQRIFYGVNCGWGFEIIMTLTTMLFGLALAGLFRSVTVDPPEILWPGVFADTALNHALHFSEKVKGAVKKLQMSQFTFFIIVFCASFIWYWFPDFLFPALGYFTFICWIAPKNVVVNQVFGMKSGIGLLPLTFDWSQIAYVSSPLLTPPWAIVNILASLVFWIFIVSPALYYSNTWSSGYLPLQSNSVYDNTAAEYNVSKVIDSSQGFRFDEQKYQAYSPLYMPVTYALNTFGLGFATIPALVIWLCLEKKTEMVQALKSIRKKPRGGDSGSNAAPSWWYLVCAVVSLALAIFACEYWPVQLRWYGVIFAFAISLVLYVPVSSPVSSVFMYTAMQPNTNAQLTLIYATANTKISIDVFCRIIAGYVFEGQVLANLWFFNLGYISNICGLQFAQNLKLGLYSNVPAREMFLVQCVGLVLSTLGQVGVVNWVFNHIPNICSSSAPNGFSCPFSRTHFNTSIIWGAIGPRRFFSSGSTYHPLLYFFILGAILPVVVGALKKRSPQGIWRHVHVPLFLGGLGYIPPASGTNYGSWAIVGLLVGFGVKRKAPQWWQRYNFVLSSGLDCAVAIAGVVIFFAVFYTGASDRFSWWGTQVHQNTCDWDSCSYLSLKEGEKFGL
ncbi:uncharacterized protein K452DRAFT_332011 [Aplosporella prunicola CBS 121167]|uniref:OPT family small oligopeptide transporter n=1 Tax=Aplosporella prunicola CBS 121167 TaxID=1176127 RepID=A0A6A6BDP8_9PEZI|nr:uncharacterized protein K452DRAFT_332011 [Aplosporella prunicola CBS 121167]KAF2142312.1 hypothetical protein K452DRAFT_332011 [Aplosporella prunicola CBS 121167]